MPETCSFLHRDARGSARCGAPAVVLVWTSGLPRWNPYDPRLADHWRPMCRSHGELHGRVAAASAAVEADGLETIVRPIAWGRPTVAHHGDTHH